MTTYNNKGDGPNQPRSDSDAAEAVRRAFSALPFEQRIATLLRIEFDMLGDATETIISAASRAADRVAEAFGCSESRAPGPSVAGDQTAKP